MGPQFWVIKSISDVMMSDFLWLDPATINDFLCIFVLRAVGFSHFFYQKPHKKWGRDTTLCCPSFVHLI